MSEKFVASNGVEISRCGRGIYDDKGGRNISMSDSEVAALREFFRHERDTELGRWRWPDDPRYLVFALKDDDEVRVLDENSGQSVTARRSNLTPGLTHSHFIGAALAYFATHTDPKPWHDAKPGEVWEITYRDAIQNGTSNRIMTCVDDGGVTSFFNEYRLQTVQYTGIESARRIWPEVVSDDS